MVPRGFSAGTDELFLLLLLVLLLCLLLLFALFLFLPLYPLPSSSNRRGNKSSNKYLLSIRACFRFPILCSGLCNLQARRDDWLWIPGCTASLWTAHRASLGPRRRPLARRNQVTRKTAIKNPTNGGPHLPLDTEEQQHQQKE